MTFVGFEEEDIQNELSSLENMVEDYESVSEEEKRENTTSFEEFFKDLHDEDDDEN